MTAKLNPKMREAVLAFVAEAVNNALDGIEEQVKPGTPRVQFDFTAENDLVTFKADFDLPLFWSHDDGS